MECWSESVKTKINITNYIVKMSTLPLQFITTQHFIILPLQRMTKILFLNPLTNAFSYLFII